MITITVVSHKSCPDGLGAAAALMARYGAAAKYCFLGYQDDMPAMESGSVAYIVDYSRPASELFALAERNVYVCWLDHHETGLMEALKLWASFHPSDRLLRIASSSDCMVTAKDFEHDFTVYTDEEMEAFIDRLSLKKFSFSADHLYCEIDMQRSGAVMTWEHLHPSVDTPLALLYIQDRDLWRWDLPDSEAVSEGLFQILKEVLENELEGHSLAAAIAGDIDIDQLQLQHFAALMMHPHYLELMRKTGEPLVQKRRDRVTEICQQRTIGSINGYRVPVCPAPVERSWVGHELCNLHPEANFSITYRHPNQGRPNQADNVLLVDLRCNGDFRCNSLARKLGGGGHRSASGFQLYRLSALRVGERFQMVGSVSEGINLQVPTPWEVTWEVLPDGKVLGRAPDREDQTISAWQFDNAWLVKRS